MAGEDRADQGAPGGEPPPFPDDGPLIDSGPAEIDIEREQAGVEPRRKTKIPPEAEMPPD